MLDGLKETYRILKKIYFGSSIVGDAVGIYLTYTHVLDSYLISQAARGIENLKYALNNNSDPNAILQAALKEPATVLVTFLILSAIGTGCIIIEGYKALTQ